MALGDEKFYFILQMIRVVGIMIVIIMEATELGRITLGGVILEGRRPFVRGFVLRGLQLLSPRAHEGCIVGELGLVLEVILSFAIAI